jgi:hypothetical protein
MVPMTDSTGLFTFAKRAFLKKSELNNTRSMLVGQAQKDGELRTGTDDFAQRVGQTLQLIVATQEYLFA